MPLIDKETGEAWSLVRENIKNNPKYTPYCGNEHCLYGVIRTVLIDGQFQCRCGWRSNIEKEFMDKHRSGK